jgi:hypothetical protein
MTHDIENAPIQNPVVVPDRTLTARQEAFCVAYAATGAAIDSYRATYGCETSSHATIRVNASRLLRQPRVAARVRELQEANGARALKSTQALIAELEEMVDADASELVSLLNGACRHCWGHQHHFQWRTSDEFSDAVEAAQRKGEALPSASGGFGYDFGCEPNPDCPSCDGVGLNRVRYNSNANASQCARRLLRGIETYPDGSVKRVLLHDQTLLRMELHKLRGLSIERSMNLNINATLPKMSDLSHDDAMAFLQRLRPLPTP